MNQKEAIKEILKREGIFQQDLADRLGQSQQAVSRKLIASSMTINKLYEYCEALGYEIVLQKKQPRKKRPDGQILLEGDRSVRSSKTESDE